VSTIKPMKNQLNRILGRKKRKYLRVGALGHVIIKAFAQENSQTMTQTTTVLLEIGLANLDMLTKNRVLRYVLVRKDRRQLVVDAKMHTAVANFAEEHNMTIVEGTDTLLRIAWAKMYDGKLKY